MNQQTAHEWMLERLYGTLSPQESAALDAYLAEHRDLAEEWRELQAAHRTMQKLEWENPPVPAQRTVLDSAAPQTPQTSPFYWKPLAAAACLLVLLFGGLLYKAYLDPRFDPHLGENAQPIQAMTVLSSEHTSKDEPITQKNTSKALPAKGSAVLVKQQSSPGQEKTFRTALELYNKAFTKTGEERRALLRSAIVYLEEAQRGSLAGRWQAFSLILIADSYRELQKPDRAIKTYRDLLDRFPNEESLCHKARASLIRLYMDASEHLAQAEEELAVFKKEAPDSKELWQLAYEYASHVQKQQPKQALKWLYFVEDHAEDGNPLTQRSQKLHRAIQEEINDSYLLRDWWALGPIPYTAFLKNHKSISKPSWNWHNKSWKISAGRMLPWQRYQFNNPITQVLFIPAAIFNENENYFYTILLITSVHIPKEQLVNFQTSYGLDPICIWLNNELLYQRRPDSGHRLGFVTFQSSINQGWTTIAMAFALDTEADISRLQETRIFINDNKNRLIPDLTIDPTQGGTITH